MPNTKYNCIIIDDESKPIELLKSSLEELYTNIHVIETFTSWKPALERLRSNGFDLLFLDISMPQKSGFDLLNLVPDLKCEVIFVTAHSEHTLDAFNHGATGYILKPVSDVLLTKAVNRALERIDLKRAAKENGIGSKKTKIGIPGTKGTDYVDADDILYMEATNRYTTVVKKSGKLLSSYSIGRYKALLESYSFCQVHRSFIVNLNHVSRFEHSGVIVMINGAEIPVSRQHKQDFLQKFEQRGEVE
jgi:two-component system LytT family response regulator